MERYKVNRYVFFKQDGDKGVILNLYNGVIVYLDTTDEVKCFQKIINKAEPLKREEFGLMFDELYHQKIIVSEDIDEKDIILRRFLNDTEQRKLHLTIFVTEHCNFNCRYCFVDKRNAHTMTEQEFRQIYRMILAREEQIGYDEISISWFGGEPLLAVEQIEKFLDYVKNNRKNTNIRISNSMVTNGYLLTLRQFLRLYRMGINVIQVTFDGSKKSHDFFRRHEEQGDTYEKIFHNLLAIKKTDIRDFLIIVRCNYDKGNLQAIEVDEFIRQYDKYFKGDKRFRLQLSPIVDYCMWGDNDGELKTYVGNLSYMVHKAEQFEVLQESLLDMVRPKKRWCPVFDSHNITINSRGEIYACDSVISDKHYRLARVNEEGRWIENTEAKKIDIKKQLGEACVLCKKMPICFGSCYLIKSRYGHNACFCTNREMEQFMTYLLNNKEKVLYVKDSTERRENV